MDVDADPRPEARASCSSTSSRTRTSPGRANEKRWQDVDELLDAGIDVISTLNIQHLESVNDVVERITGVKQQETIPDDDRASGRAGRARRHDARGAPAADGARQHLSRRARSTPSLANYFRPGNLAALRELALLWVADRVEENLQQYMEDHGIVERMGDARACGRCAHGRARRRRAHPPRRPHGRARRDGDLIGVHVRPTDGLADGPPRAPRGAP